MRSILFLPFFLALLLPASRLAAQPCSINAYSAVSLFAGNGTLGYSGDSGPATAAQLSIPYSVAVDASTNVYFADFSNHVVRKVDAVTGTITTFAGDGTAGISGDNGPATLAQLDTPNFIAFDSAWNLYICDMFGYEVRKVTPGGTITTVAGTGTAGYSGDGGPATVAQVSPYVIAIDPSDNLYISDISDFVVRKVTPAGTMSTFCGNGTLGPAFSGDGGPATAAKFGAPEGIAFDPGTGDTYIWDDINHYIRKVNACGILSTVYGSGVTGGGGDGGPASSAQFNDAEGMIFRNGYLYLSDWKLNRIRVIDPCGIINSIGGMGTGPAGSFGAVSLQSPEGMALDANNNLYVPLMGAYTVIKVLPNCSPTATLVCTPSPAYTPNCFITITPTPTGSLTPTPTFSPTNTPTSTGTFTATNSPTASPTPTASDTPSPTATSTPSSTGTLAATSTPSMTPTNSPSSTPTSSATFSPTATPTVTISPTGTPTPTGTLPAWTSTPGTAGTGLFIYPNPSNGSTVNVRVGLAIAGPIRAKLFTTAFRKVLDEDEGRWPIGTANFSLTLEDSWGVPLANGLYYVVVTGPQGNLMAKLVILK